MRQFLALFVTYLLIFSCEERPKEAQEVDSGVPLELAIMRKKQVSEVTYSLSFFIPSDKKAAILSKLKLDITLAHLDTPLYLDFKEETAHLQSVYANGGEVEIVHKNEHILIAPEHLVTGKNSITINFTAGELSLNRNEEYLYTLLVPDRARTLFPCFDQPDIKASYQLEITAPRDWEVLCGAPEVKTEERKGFVRHEFAPSDSMSTYLFSFVAGKFKKTVQNPGAFDMAMLFRETDEAKLAQSTDTIFNLHQRSLAFLENYTAKTFPFQKLDFATIPGFQYGGMEHLGAIQYRESALFLDESAPVNRKLGRAKLIAHETAHMWFGDLVTMKWFNDVWMKEVFANFMADKIVNPAFPDIDHNLSFMTSHYPRAYAEDRTQGTNPIRQELENLNNAGSLYGSIIYNKAPIMMRQLELLMGEQTFREGIQEYIQSYAFENAEWGDLISILDQKTDSDIKKWSDVWVNSSGRPVFEEFVTYDANDNIASFEIRQHAEGNSKHVWPQTFEIALMYDDSVENVTVAMQNEIFILSDLIGKPKPNAIRYNANGMGYGVFPTDEESLKTISQIENPVTRGYAYINSYENALNGTVKANLLFELYIKSLGSERNALLTDLISDYANSLFWKYLTEKQRRDHQPKFANRLWAQLQSDLPANIKKTLFNTFRSIAYSEVSRSRLYDVWSKATIIPNLRLNEDDYTEMAMDLGLYGHADSSSILETTKDSIRNPDKLERYIFLLPSVSEDVTVRDRFFESLKKEKNRAKEAWVLAALNNLNHPLRQKEAIRHLRPSLELLEEIQKTGDIFFPKGWLNGTIGKYTTSQAYDILQKFIAANPDLNPSLLQKVLQASDDLYRVRSLRKK